MNPYSAPNSGAGDGSHHFTYPNPSQHRSYPSAEELATNELSRDLAPIMNAGSMAHNNYHPEQHGHGSGVQIGSPYGEQVTSPFSNQSSDGDGTSEKKRKKVSRACDICRQKKMKCEPGEEGENICKGCKKSGANCLYVRVPFKRGPSKGYIKSLSDRLQTVEGQLQAQNSVLQSEPHFRHPSDIYSAPAAMDHHQKKRTYSESKLPDDHSAPYKKPRAIDNRPPQSSASSYQNMPAAGFSDDILYDVHITNGGVPPLSQQSHVVAKIAQQSNSIKNLQRGDQSHRGHLEESGAFERYLHIIHIILPLLPHSKQKLISSLSKCNPALVEAFNESLEAAVTSFGSSDAPPADPQQAKNAACLVLASQLESPSTRCFAENLVHLQSLILMAIQASNCPPNLATGLSTGSLGTWLGNAVSLANQMNLKPGKTSDNDVESDDILSRKVWWTLVILDRWHVIGTASPPLIFELSSIDVSQDRAEIGESLYMFARLSIILGHKFSPASALANDPKDPVLPPLSYLLEKAVRAEQDTQRGDEELPFIHPSDTTPIINLSYWVIKVMNKLAKPQSENRSLIELALEMVKELGELPKQVSPLMHYFSTFAALTLIESSTHENTKNRAERGLRSLTENMFLPTGWSAAIRAMIATRYNINAAVTSSSAAESQHTASQGLLHLADLATAQGVNVETVGNESSKEVEKEHASDVALVSTSREYQELRGILQAGYLNVVCGESARETSLAS